jgi:WD40 repeat protein
VILPVADGDDQTPSVIGDTTYQHDLRATPNTFESFALPNAATSTVIGTQAEDYFALEHDNATGVLWAIRNAPLPLTLGQINKTTGAFTAGPTVTGLQGTQNITGLAFVNSSSTFYVSGADGTVSTLYSLNPTTGVLTAIGQTGTTLMIDIALNNAGVMYGHDIGSDSIYTINTGTGAATLIGPTGIPANFAQSIDVDKSTGVLYGWVYQGTGVNQFVSFNLTTGAATALATPTNKEYEGATVPVELQSFSVD